jgi:Ca2+-binding RTX toxin-like protein
VGAGTDTVSNFENLTGSGLDDVLTGSSAANVLMGLDGNDTITGGGGADSLTGGLGNDHFLFAGTNDSTAKATDLITDFSAGDIIDLSGIDADTKTKGDQAFLGVSPSAGVIAHSVTWFESNGNTIIQADVNGSGGAEFTLVLAGINHGLTSADFVL